MYQFTKKNEASPYFSPPVGSQLIINEPISIPPGRTRVFLQNGELTLKYDKYVPNCNIEVRKLDRTQTQEVKAGTYTITKIQPTLEQVVKRGSVKLAALGMFFAGEDDGGTTMVYEGYHFWLEQKDPNVMRISCRGVFADPHEAFPPSINEIRQSLGKIAELKIQ